MKTVNKKTGWLTSVSTLLALSMFSGCSTVGPDLYEGSFEDYNDAVRKTTDGQMLANLVRMRYMESPIFLQVASISTSFSLSGNVGATAGFPESAPNNYGLSAGAGFSETPTISFSLPASEAYYGRLLAPLSADQVTSLILGGFDSELVFLTASRGMNGLRNASVDFATSPNEMEASDTFREALTLMTKLRREGLIDLELGGKETFWSSPIAVDAKSDISQVLMLGAASYAMGNDAEIVGYPDGTWQTHRYEKHMALRFAPTAGKNQDAMRLKELLGLKSDFYNFSIVDAEMVNAEKARGVLGQYPGALDPSVLWVEIGLRGRSMMEILQVASKTVQVPEADVKRGIVHPNRSADLKKNSSAAQLVILSSEDEPNSSLRIKYRGVWFYVEDSDLESREAFAVLNAVFAVVGGTVPGAHPVLTLPVN